MSLQEQPMRHNNRRSKAQRGYILLTTGIAVSVILGIAGLAVDLGRMYIARNETQTFVDFAAIAAVMELDGTTDGFARANSIVTNSENSWNFSTEPFMNPQVEFSTAASGPWEAAPGTGSDYRFVSVRATVNVPMSMIHVITQQMDRPISARAVAGQVKRNGTPEGTFPFSPLAHDANDPLHGGLTPGKIYTLRWAANPSLKGGGGNVCAADKHPHILDLYEQGGSEERGYIEETSASTIRQAILGDYQTTIRQIGESVVMTGGTKQTQRLAIIERIHSDLDITSPDYATYLNNLNAGGANGRRLVIAPVNSGAPDNRIVIYGLFYLLNDYEYKPGGNFPFCAEYIGPGMLGSRRRAASSEAGFYMAKLVR
jgi:hypothetical protein